MRLPHAPHLAFAALCAGLAGAALPASQAPAATWLVTQLGDDGPGSLRQALALAQPGDRVEFALPGTILLTSELVIDRALTVDATSVGGVTLSRADGVHTRLVRIEPGAFVELRGLTLTRGSSDDGEGGGAILNWGTLLLSESFVTLNFVNFDGGAGIRNEGFLLLLRTTLAENEPDAIFNEGLLLLTDSTIEDTFFGGALWNGGYASIQESTLQRNGTPGAEVESIASDGELYVADSEVQPDVTILGGTARFVRTRFLPSKDDGSVGVFNHAELLIVDSELDDQTALANAGLVNTGSARVLRSSIVGNAGGYGLDNSGWLELVNVTLSGNRSYYAPSALWNSGYLKLLHATVTANDSGVALHNQGTVVARNSLIGAQDPASWGYAQDCVDEGSIVPLGGNLDSDGSCGFESTADPMLGPLATYGGATRSHEPMPGSPLLDAAESCFLATDQRGVPRPLDGDGDGDAACDVGAHERGLRARVAVWPEGRARGPSLRRARGAVSLALFGADDFDVRDVEPRSLSLLPGGAPVARGGGPRYRDLDDDGHEDLIARFRLEPWRAKRLCLAGRLRDASVFGGCDGI